MKHLKYGIFSLCNILLTIVFTTILFLIATKSIQSTPVTIVNLTVTFICVLAFGMFLDKKLSSKTVFTHLFICMILIQLVCGYFLMIDFKTWDVASIIKNARAYALNEPINSGYFARCPNNLGILLLVSGLFKLSNTILGTTSVYVTVIFNIFSIDLAIYYTWKIAKLIKDEQFAYRVGILCTLFAPFYLYVPICYTDTVSMPFLTAVIYYFLKHLSQEETSPGKTGVNNKKVYLSLFALGAITYWGYKIKGSVGIVFIAILICLFLKNKLSDFFKKSCVYIIGFLAAILIWNTTINHMELITEEESYAYELPMTHYIMMGLNGLGNFNSEDVKYTVSFDNYDKKQEATVKIIKERLEDKGFIGLIKHVFIKSSNYTWNYGTCYAERYLGDFGDAPLRKNILHEFVLSKGQYHETFYMFTQSFYLILLVSLVVDLILDRKCRLELFFLRLIFLGGVLFLMLWETHPRYTLNFMPIVIILGAKRLDIIIRSISLWFKQKSHNYVLLKEIS